MKNHLPSISVLALLMASGSAFAADLPSHKAPPPPPPPPPAPALWTGCYVGLNAGWTWGDHNQVSNQSIDSEGATGLTTTYAASNAPLDGFIGGGQAGCNYQFPGSSFVLGLETDIQGTTASGHGAAAGLGAVGPNALLTVFDNHRRLDYLGTVRGRLGFLITPTLEVYGTGGLAYGGVTANTSAFSFWSPFGQFGGGAGNFSGTLVGWTAGAGVEWMFMPNWSAKAEYLHYNLGHANWTTSWLVPGNFGGVGANFAVSRATFDGHIVRLGVNYHFNAAPPPMIQY